jgi:hypothetical protein
VYTVATKATDSKHIPQMVLASIIGYKLDLPHLVQGCQRKDVLSEVLAQVEVYVQGGPGQSCAGNTMLIVSPEGKYSVLSQNKVDRHTLLAFSLKSHR